MSKVIPIRRPVDQEAFEELLETIEPEWSEPNWGQIKLTGLLVPNSGPYVPPRKLKVIK